MIHLNIYFKIYIKAYDKNNWYQRFADKNETNP